MASLLRFSLVAAFVCFSMAEGCGYVGVSEIIDDDDSVTNSGGSKGGDGDGDSGGTGATMSGDGGRPEGAGGFSFGGLGGMGGEPLDVPTVPCSIGCVEPFFLYRTFELGVPGLVKEDEGATVEIGDELVHWDNYALVTTQGEPGTDAQVTDYIRRVVGSHLYYRAWIYVPEGAIVDWLKVLAFNGVSTEGIDVRLKKGGVVEIYSQMTGDFVLSGEGVVPEDEWFCLRTEMFVDNVNGSIQVAIGSEPVVGVGKWDTLPGAEIDNIVYGIAETGDEQTGATIYTDDVIAAGVPIGCGPLP